MGTKTEKKQPRFLGNIVYTMIRSVRPAVCLTVAVEHINVFALAGICIIASAHWPPTQPGQLKKHVGIVGNEAFLT